MQRWILSAVTVVVLAGCGGSSDDDPVDSTVDTTVGSVTTAAQVTTAIEVDTTVAITTTTAAPTTTTPTTTTIDVTDEYQRLLRTADPRLLELSSPGSPAYLYVEALIAGSALGRPSGPGPRLDDFVLDGGLVADFSREGVPLSGTVFALDAEVTAGDAIARAHSVRYFDGSVQIVALVDNTAGANNAYFQWEAYVAPDGRQFEFFPAAIPGDGVLAGANSIVLYVAETDVRGGRAVGSFIGGGELSVVLPD